mmetsp:Transcript_29116/g.40025  ORF Transcript_29116/g.40025 Transcript_29116/m.40025 type:complete len:202 (-) Transcript_29116:733-1338(-)
MDLGVVSLYATSRPRTHESSRKMPGFVIELLQSLNIPFSMQRITSENDPVLILENHIKLCLDALRELKQFYSNIGYASQPPRMEKQPARDFVRDPSQNASFASQYNNVNNSTHSQLNTASHQSNSSSNHSIEEQNRRALVKRGKNDGITFEQQFFDSSDTSHSQPRPQPNPPASSHRLLPPTTCEQPLHSSPSPLFRRHGL